MYEIEKQGRGRKGFRLESKALRAPNGSSPTKRSDWKLINESVRLYLFTYYLPNFLSNMFAYALNRLQFFSGGSHYGLHTSK